jgi:hypothetical protein
LGTGGRAIDGLASNWLAINWLAINRFAINRLAINRLAINWFAITRLLIHGLATKALGTALAAEKRPIGAERGMAGPWSIPEPGAPGVATECSGGRPRNKP